MANMTLAVASALITRVWLSLPASRTANVQKRLLRHGATGAADQSSVDIVEADVVKGWLTCVATGWWEGGTVFGGRPARCLVYKVCIESQ